MHKATIFLTHIITNILIQAFLMAVLFWPFDTTVAIYFQYSLCCMALLIVDYFVCYRIEYKFSNKMGIKSYTHFLDVIILNPSLFLTLLLVIGVFGPIEMVMLVPLIIVLTINILIFIERWICILYRDITTKTG